ncbi:conserved protein of unknown function [Pseudomonas marincola]|uniref:HNH endonuclease n=1 Tax=Pseudomonas marincola TaxID=437900 RepID=A0A653E3F3_9PSED|nr:conserved protein of unknown function [Pseudomonas marincola]
MVANIPPPKEDSVEVFLKILDERKRHLGFYQRIKNDWQKNIEIYIEHKGNPAKIAALDLLLYTKDEDEAEERKKSLIGLYSPQQGKIPHEILSKMRREHGLICCPSCGEAGIPGTLDHYLPKDEFPELSVLLLNLTPMCSECQQAKGTQYKTNNGSKKYIHPYFDEVTTPLYKINFQPPYNSPKFSIVMNGDIEPDLLELVNEHTSGIDLILRIKKFCNTKYVHLLKSAKRHRDKGGRVGLGEIIEILLQSEEDKSINCWEAVFYRSALADKDLIDYLENGELPDNL